MTKPTLKLYEIANQYQRLLDSLDLEREDVLSHTDRIEQMLEEIKESLEEKAINVAAYLKSIDAEVEGIKAAESEMKKRRSSLEKKSQYLKDYLLHNLRSCEIENISSPWFLIKVKKNPACVDITDEFELPEEFIKTEIIKSPIKSKIKFFIEQGGECPGAKLVQNYRLEIK